MNLKCKILVNVITVAASALGLAASALAGEGGIAGTATFQLDSTTGNVENAAVAAAVGKDSAYAASNNTFNSKLDAFAVGTGGTFNTNGSTNYITSVSPDNNLGTSQANDLFGAVNINAIQGTMDSHP